MLIPNSSNETISPKIKVHLWSRRDRPVPMFAVDERYELQLPVPEHLFSSGVVDRKSRIEHLPHIGPHSRSAAANWICLP
jgi:hypothetical protein